MYGGALFLKFPSIYIRSAIMIAFWAGISMGTHVAFTTAFGFPISKTYSPYIQTHGYLQLMGWVGLFVMGISIHFLPRLANFHNLNKALVRFIYIFMIFGLSSRYLFHSILPYLTESTWYPIIGSVVVLSSILVLLSIILYMWFLFSIVSIMKPELASPNRDIRYFLIMNILGWIIYGLGTVILLTTMVLNHHISLNHEYHLFLVDLFIHFTIFPICIGVGLRVIPLFLRLKTIQWDVKRFSLIYLVIVVTIFNLKFQVLGDFLNNIQNVDILIYVLSIIKDSLIIWFIFKINIFSKIRFPWNSSLIKNNSSQPGKNYGDFGPSQGLVRSAFVWLAIGLIIDMIAQIGFLFEIPTDIRLDGIRHMWLAGFVSLLIMGLGLRMVPPMTGIRREINPRKIFWLTVIMNISVLFRTLYLIVPRYILSIIPNGGGIAMQLFGLSGIFFLFGLAIFYYLLKPMLKAN